MSKTVVAEDLYPTRSSTNEAWMARVDPVLWGDPEPTPFVTRAELQDFEQQGFLIKSDLFSDAEVEALSEAADNLRVQPAEQLGQAAIREHGSNALRTLFHLEQHADIFDKLSRSERVAGIASRILNDDVYIHQSRLNYKPGFTGREFYWHSDFETWHAEDGMPRARAISVSILLTDNSALNGPLMLMPGSQTEFICCHGETPDNNHETSLQKQEVGTPSENALTRLAEKCGIEHVSGRAGTAIFFDCNTMHGSNGNITPFPRSNAFFVYNALSNQPEEPFAAKKPRPEHLGRRTNIAPLSLTNVSLG